jgi:hypothetical protein
VRGNGTPRHCARRRRNPSDDRRAPGSAGPSSVTADEIIGLLSEMPGGVIDTASEATGAPEVARGDSFFFDDPNGDPANRRRPHNLALPTSSFAPTEPP